MNWSELAIVLLATYVVWKIARRREAFTPVFCSTRTSECTDLGTFQRNSTW